MSPLTAGSPPIVTVIAVGSLYPSPAVSVSVNSLPSVVPEAVTLEEMFVSVFVRPTFHLAYSVTSLLVPLAIFVTRSPLKSAASYQPPNVLSVFVGSLSVISSESVLNVVGLVAVFPPL